MSTDQGATQKQSHTDLSLIRYTALPKRVVRSYGAFGTHDTPADYNSTVHVRMQVHEMDQNSDENEQKLIRETLETVLASERFEAAPQMSAFLRYVVEQAVTGNHNRIKAFTVAVDALGKPDTFDPQNDPLVRVLAGRLRAALTGYKEEHPKSALFITMNPGSYVPIFQKGNTNEEAVPESPEDTMRVNSAERINSAGETLTQGFKSDTIEATSVQNESSDEVRVSENQQNAESLDSQTVRQEQRPATDTEPQSSRLQKLAIASILALALSLVYFGYQRSALTESENQALAADSPLSSARMVRVRPEDPVVFVSAADHVNPFEISLNALVSSVISEGNYLKVHRYFDIEHIAQFWPEDYMLNLTVLDLPDETRIDMQLVEAQSGRLVHSQAVIFSPMAAEQLTHEEMDALIDITRSIVDESGPLRTDYSSRDISR